MDKIREILESIKPGVDFGGSEDMWKEGLIDSFDVVCMVSELDEAFDIKIGVNDLIPENFASISAIEKMVQKLSQD